MSSIRLTGKTVAKVQKILHLTMDKTDFFIIVLSTTVKALVFVDNIWRYQIFALFLQPRQNDELFILKPLFWLTSCYYNRGLSVMSAPDFICLIISFLIFQFFYWESRSVEPLFSIPFWPRISQ